MSNDVEYLVKALALAAEANEQFEQEEQHIESLIRQRDELLEVCKRVLARSIDLGDGMEEEKGMLRNIIAKVRGESENG